MNFEVHKHVDNEWYIWCTNDHGVGEYLWHDGIAYNIACNTPCDNRFSEGYWYSKKDADEFLKAFLGVMNAILIADRLYKSFEEGCIIRDRAECDMLTLGKKHTKPQRDLNLGDIYLHRGLNEKRFVIRDSMGNLALYSKDNYWYEIDRSLEYIGNLFDLAEVTPQKQDQASL